MVWFNQWIKYIRTLREESKYTGQERVQVRNLGSGAQAPSPAQSRAGVSQAAASVSAYIQVQTSSW